MEQKKFQKKMEDFICEKCGFVNVGDGYTNHCHKCLQSKHVDVNPGDRAESCDGLMEPIGLENKNGAFLVIHKCTRCGCYRKNKAQVGDDFDKLISLSSNDNRGRI